MFIKVTAIGYQTNIATTFLENPQTVLVNSLKIWSIILGKKGSEIKDESSRNTIIVKESIEEIYEQINKE